jgi:hypothetical protein
MYVIDACLQMEDGESFSMSRPPSAHVKRQDSFESSGSTDTVFHITFGCPAAHFLGFHDGGLKRIMQGLGASDKRRCVKPDDEFPCLMSRLCWMCRLHWMSILQATGGVSTDVFVDFVRGSLQQAEKLFNCSIDTYSAGKKLSPHTLPSLV